MSEARGPVVEVRGQGGLLQRISAGRHALLVDEPVLVGGTDLGPTPYDLLVGALGACTAMTLRMYAARRGWKLDDVQVRLRHDRMHAADCAECETKDGRVDAIDVEVVLVGELDEAQRARLLEIAARCPVKRTLEGEIVIRMRAG